MDNATDPVHSGTVRPSLFSNSSFLASGVDDAYQHFVVLFKAEMQEQNVSDLRYLLFQPAASLDTSMATFWSI